MSELKNIPLTFVLAFASTLSMAQTVDVSATMDTTTIAIGEQATMHITVTSPAQSKIVWPVLKDTLRKEVEVLGVSKIDTTYNKDDITTRYLEQSIKLTSFDSGFWAVKPLEFIIDGDTLLSPPFLLTVHTMDIDTAKAIFDIKGPMEVDYTLLDWLREYWRQIAIVAGGLIVLALLVYFLIKKLREKPAVVEAPKPPPVPAHVIALKKLQELKEKKLWQVGKTKQYHIALSEIVREYIENRFNIPALEQTTDEIMSSMRATPVDNEIKARLKQTFELSDLVKFAKANPIGTENEMCMMHAEYFINQTLPQQRPASIETETSHA